MSEATTNKPDDPRVVSSLFQPLPPPDPRWSFGAGFLSGFVCGILGVVLGGYLGHCIDMHEAARWQAEGRMAVDAWPVLTIVGVPLGACFGWLFGWLLTAFLPPKRTRTRQDYIAIWAFGLLPMAAIIAAVALFSVVSR